MFIMFVSSMGDRQMGAAAARRGRATPFFLFPLTSPYFHPEVGNLFYTTLANGRSRQCHNEFSTLTTTIQVLCTFPCLQVPTGTGTLTQNLEIYVQYHLCTSIVVW